MSGLTLLFVTPKIRHHASFSGYHQLVKYLKISSKILIRSNRISPMTLPIDSITLRRWSKSGFYSPASLSLELKSLLQECRIIHHLYGEDTCLISPLLKSAFNKRVMATFHQPPNFFRQYMLQKILHYLDHIVVLSTVQRDFLVRVLKDESKISFIPHGVEFNRFSPSSYEMRNCLMVGQWLRDFDTALKAMKEVEKREIKITFDVVLPISTPKNILKKIEKAPLSKIRVHYNISEEALLELYSKSYMFLMTLVDFTASNSLLEAMASALPIIITDVGGVRDYVDETCGLFVKNPRSIAEAIVYLLEDENVSKTMGKKSRAKARFFSWNRVSHKYKEIYKTLEISESIH